MRNSFVDCDKDQIFKKLGYKIDLEQKNSGIIDVSYLLKFTSQNQQEKMSLNRSLFKYFLKNFNENFSKKPFSVTVRKASVLSGYYFFSFSFTLEGTTSMKLKWTWCVLNRIFIVWDKIETEIFQLINRSDYHSIIRVINIFQI